MVSIATKETSFINDNRKRAIFIPLAFLLRYLVTFLLDPYSPRWQNYFDHHIVFLILEWGYNLILSVLIAEISIRINNRLNGSISWTENPIKRLLIETSLNVLSVMVCTLTIKFGLMYLGTPELAAIGESLSIEKIKAIILWMVGSTIIAMMIMGINIGNHLIINWRNEAIRSTELNQAAMESELQSLKLQIDPHFVFNNLSVLSEIILENQKQGYEYAESFSRIYKYMLVNSKKDLILLKDELKFLSSYMFLIEHRFGEGVKFDIRVDKDHQNLYMPPLTLQLLVENALKHNKTNKKVPLRVSIYSGGRNELIVENVLLPMEKPIDSSGIGIKNIIRRYNLLSQKEPEIIKSPHSFKVIVPLIKL